MTLPFDKKVAAGTMGMIVVVAFWISPELGFLALGGVVLLSLISGLSWLLTRRKRRTSRF
jgi:ABC-type protease/lipase transport system fused ATPase/permease subunit